MSSTTHRVNGHSTAVPAGHRAASSDTTASNNGNGEAKKSFKPQMPLTSWADTRQNTAAIAFLLGCVFTVGLTNGLSLFSSSNSDEVSLLHVQQLSSKERLWNAITGPRLGAYIAFQVIFHMMEFFTTAIYNPEKASPKCECHTKAKPTTSDY